MKKIMIVDDEKISLMMTEHILRTEYETVCASSGTEAYKLYATEQPDLILTDLRMPWMSGTELLTKLRADYDRVVPVMFMTSDPTDDAESQGFESGAVDYIRKPFRADILLQRIDNILHNVEKIEGLTRAATTDPMTGLLNKASAQLSIDRMCRETPGVLMMIDLDSFKLINDTYGHEMGDTILIRFAEILRSAVRDADIVGRLGGDEFVAYCQHISEESVIADKSRYINEQILLSAREFLGENMDIPLGVSIGVATAPREGNDYTTLFGKADKALYEVKQKGKHGYHIYHDEFSDADNEVEDSSDIAKVMSVLSERNRAKGAFALPLEQFTLLYRFLSRMEYNYHSGNKLIVFQIHGDDKEAGKIADAFYECVCNSLRASDVVTQNTKNRVMILLLESNKMFADMVVERILKKWKKSDNYIECEITHEMSVIE